jgi:hypothetical protein
MDEGWSKANCRGEEEGNAAFSIDQSGYDDRPLR